MSDVRRLAPRLRASWRRSEHYGVSTERVEPTFTGSPDTDSLFYQCGQQVLSGLQGSLANEPVSLMIADRDGLVLSRLCNDTAISRSLDRVHLAPGFYYAERDAGTNGLGLSLADRAPSLVSGEEHFCTALQGYTCAAVPVLDPLSGDLVGSVNLTTWSDQSSGLLLALAQAAAANTSALMLVRASGRQPRAVPRGQVFRVEPGRLAAGESDPCRSRAWQAAVDDAGSALAAGRVLAVVGEPGAGKRALVTLARRRLARRERVLGARPPAAQEVDAWLALWTPELARADLCVIVSDVETLPAWAGEELAAVLAAARRVDGGAQPFVLAARDYAAIPEPLASLVDTVVEAPALRLRRDDVMPLARFFAREERHREADFTATAARALSSYDWPQNARQLKRIVREAVTRAEVIDARHLPPEVFSGSGHQLSRLETLERDEIVRCLTEPGITLVQAAAELGLARATLYRKLAQYDIHPPRNGR